MGEGKVPASVRPNIVAHATCSAATTAMSKATVDSSSWNSNSLINSASVLSFGDIVQCHHLVRWLKFHEEAVGLVPTAYPQHPTADTRASHELRTCMLATAHYIKVAAAAFLS